MSVEITHDVEFGYHLGLNNGELDINTIHYDEEYKRYTR